MWYCYFVSILVIWLLPYVESARNTMLSRVQQTAVAIRGITFHSGKTTTCDARSLEHRSLRLLQVGCVQLFEHRLKLRSGSAVLKVLIYRFLLSHNKLLLKVNCGVKVDILYMCSFTIEP